MRRRTLDHGLQHMPGLTADARSMPQSLQYLVAFPPVAFVEKVDAVEILVALAPVLVIEIGQVGFGAVVGVSRGVTSRVRRLSRKVVVGRKGSFGVSFAGRTGHVPYPNPGTFENQT